MQNSRQKPFTLTSAKQKKVDKLKEELPKDWVKRFLDRYESIFQAHCSRAHAYNILNGCREDHQGFKVIESIAKEHQELLAQI